MLLVPRKAHLRKSLSFSTACNFLREKPIELYRTESLCELVYQLKKNNQFKRELQKGRGLSVSSQYWLRKADLEKRSEGSGLGRTLGSVIKQLKYNSACYTAEDIPEGSWSFWYILFLRNNISVSYAPFLLKISINYVVLTHFPCEMACFS